MGPRILITANMPRKKLAAPGPGATEEQPKQTKKRAPSKKTLEPETAAMESPSTEVKPKALFGRAAARKAAEPALDEPQPVAPKQPRKSSRKAAQPSAEDDLPVPIWRQPQRRATTSVEAKDDIAAPPGPPRRARAARDKGAVEAPQPALTAAAEGPAAKPIIPTPKDAPQIVLRDGVPTIVRNQVVYPPLFFFGSSLDERRAGIVLDEAKLAGEAGVHIHSHLVDLEIDPKAVVKAVEFAAYMLSQSLKADPEAQVIFRMVFIAPRGWDDRYSDARFFHADGSLADPSVCDDAFWGVARECVIEFVQQILRLPSSEHVMGVHLERGEWFMASGTGYDTSAAAKAKFRDWARTRYNHDPVALRAAWFDADAAFETLEVPPYRKPKSAGFDKFVRSDRKERCWVDYHLFISDATVQRISDLAYAIKSASNGRLLVGVSYGYTFEWSHPSSGHLSLGKLLRTPEVDIIAGPPSYKAREPGATAAFPGPIDSFAINGKLYISEEDFKTSIGQGNEPDDFNPTIKTPQALESVHWRGLGAAISHASGVCWMDLWGNGWLKTSQIWSRAERVRAALIHRMASPQSDPDVAILVDERALAYLVDEEGFSLLVQNVRESVLRSGLSSAFYLLSDLAHREEFPESKLYVFLNAWDVRADLRAAIKSRLQRADKVLFWLYAAALFDSGRESLERAREVTGIALKPQPFYSRAGTTILNRRHPLCEALPESGMTGRIQLDPTYFAIPEDAQVLGEYTQTGLPSFVVKHVKPESDPATHWRSVFLGEPVVTPGLIRALGQMAGAHVWSYQDDVVHARGPFLTVHCTGTGQRTLALPPKAQAYNLLSESWATADSSNVRFSAVDGSTHVFLVGSREEIEGILSKDPRDLLAMAELPEKRVNTTRFDVDRFEVPMVKLGDWMDEAGGDELADELLLRPQIALEEPEADSERAGRRRRRRRRDRGGTEEGASAHRENTSRIEDPELGMSVTFRKRE